MARDKRERILEAAALVFSQKGYHQAKVEDIAIQAGIGKGTVYEYFSSKLELFQEMFSAVMGRYFEELHDRQGGTTVRQRLQRVLELHLEFINKYAQFARVTFVDSFGTDEELDRWMYRQRQEKVERIRELIQEGIACGEFREVDAGLLAEMFTGAMTALIIPVLMEGKETNPGEVSAQVMEILLRGIK